MLKTFLVLSLFTVCNVYSFVKISRSRTHRNYFEMNRSRIRIFPGSTVCAETMLQGEISFGNNCVVHPYVQILALAGPIIIGENCVIEERVQILHRGPPGVRSSRRKGPPLVIGTDNLFEVGCRIEAKRIGDRNIFESKSLAGSKVIVTNDCIIGAGCKLRERMTIRRNSIVYGQNCELREGFAPPSVSHIGVQKG